MVISSKSCQKFRFNCLAALQPLNGFMFLQSWQTVSNLQSSLSRAIIGKVIYNIMFQNETLTAKCFRFSHLMFSQKQEMFLSECQVHERALRESFRNWDSRGIYFVRKFNWPFSIFWLHYSKLIGESSSI